MPLRDMLQKPLQGPGYLLIGLVLLPGTTAGSNVPQQHSYHRITAGRRDDPKGHNLGD